MKASAAIPPGRCCLVPFGLITLSVALCSEASARQDNEPISPIVYRVAGSDRFLWVAQVRGARSSLFTKSLFKPFGVGKPINRRVEMLCPSEDAVYTLFTDNSLHRYFIDGDTPERNLPFRERPLHLEATHDRLFAIVTPRVAQALTTQPASAPADSAKAVNNSQLHVVQYDGSAWSAAGLCPPEVTAGAAPRLLALDHGLLLFWSPPGTGTIECRRLESDQRSWSDFGRIESADIKAYWTLQINRTPHVLLTAVSSGTGPSVSAFRRLGDQWRPMVLSLSALPSGATPREYRDAFEFRQRIGFLVTDAGGEAYLDFSKTDEAQTDDVLRLSEVLANQPGAAWGQLRLIVLILMVVILATIFPFRRESIFIPITLPAGWQIAFLSQRLIACAIDILPFTIAATMATHSGWVESVSALADWGFRADLSEENFPAREVWTWWGLSAGGYTVYALVMELITRRTIGKLLLRSHVISIRGRSAAAPGNQAGPGQIFVRNITRVAELFPPFWPLALLVLLTRNRQRLGDIYAGTVVAQPAPPREPAPPQAEHDGGDDDGPESPTS